jgi:hypothetical protein
MILQPDVVRVVPPVHLLPFEEPVREHQTAMGLRGMTERWLLKDALRTGVHGLQTHLLRGFHILDPERDQSPGEQLDLRRRLIRDHRESREIKTGGVVLPAERFFLGKRCGKTLHQRVRTGDRIPITHALLLAVV